MSTILEDTAKKDTLTEDHDADSNSSDAVINGNKNKSIKKKTLSDMLKKLNPDPIKDSEFSDIPTFLKKDSPQPSAVTDNNEESMATVNSDKTQNDSKTSTSSLVHSKVSSPKLNTDVYKCSVENCIKSFSHVNDFKQHMNNQHSNLDSLPCCFCFSSFVLENYFEHLSCHIKNLMKCLYCQVSHDTREELLKHLSEKHPSQPKKINVCIRILNNLRGKKSNSENGSDSKSNNSKSLSEDNLKVDPTNDAPKSRNRKASKPLKSLNQFDSSDEIEIEFVKNAFKIKCDKCTFSCNTEIHLKQHVQEGHDNPAACSLFKCKLCKMNSNEKDYFETHLAHHTGNHTIRYYTCPYCVIISNNMETIENHISDEHPDNAFRFEVIQEKIDYLQNLVFCPICHGAYQWQQNFVSHLDFKHNLKDLSNYFLNTYSSKEMPSQLKALRSLFKNLLPDAPDYDTETSAPNVDGDNDEYQEEKKEKNVKEENSKDCKSSEHPLLYDMLSKKPLESSKPVIIQPSSPQSPEELQYSERYPPADLTQYVIKKGNPTTFSCNLCPFECTKTTHFRRHMDIHKRNESLSDGYKCGYCQFAHPRLNCIRFHLGKYHADLPYMMTRIVDNSYISMGPEDDPTLKRSKAKIPFVTSTPTFSQRPERERRAPVKMENDFNWTPNKSSGKSPVASTSQINYENLSLSEFESQLPTIMIYPEPIKCPKCNFSNRVRINLLNHLKLHKDEEMNNFDIEASENKGNDSSVEEEQEEENCNGKSSLKSESLNPLFNFLSDKKCNPDFLDDAEEVTFVTRANLSGEYQHFSFKVPNTNHFQCKECNFTHRYPSKVKRHYYYKHAPAFPYKCGYCSFGAVEGGKVKKHCKIVHPNKREMVVKINVYKKNSNEGNTNSLVGSRNVSKHQDHDDDDKLVMEQDSVKISKQYVYKNSNDNNDLWLPQFVTLLDDDIQCCKLCGYQQEGSSSLREHVLTAHLEFYPYSCTHCGFALMDLSRVKKHIDTHHPGLEYCAYLRSIVDDNINENNSIRKNHCADNYSSDEGNDSNSQNSQMIIDESSQQEIESNEMNEDNHEDAATDGMSSEEVEEDKNEKVGKQNLQVTSDSFNGKRQFKCYYCGVISKWNRRDIRLHVLHVHLHKKVYTCRHCGFGNSKSKAVVRTHCLKFHPTKNVSVKDELALFNAIIPIEDANGIVTMVLSNKNGEPILDLPEDGSALQRQDSKSSKINQSKLLKTSKSDTGKCSPVKSSSSNSKLHECHWKCKQCSYATNTEIDVKYHLLSSHLNLRPYSCPHCHVYLSRVELVLNHIEKYHPDKKKEVRDTLEEKAQYLQKNIEYVGSKSQPILQNMNDDEDVIDENFAKVMEQQKNPRYSSGYFRCLLCGYRDPRNDKTKYHIIKSHLNLRQFSCPHCNQYMWGRQQVLTHIEQEHPGKEVFVKRTFHEYDEFLRKNIKKFSFPKTNCQDTAQKDIIKTRAIPRIQCGSCSFVTDSELSLAAHKRTHKIFQCVYCEYKHMLAARVQSHCLEKHPNLFVRFKLVDSSNFESTKITGQEEENEDNYNADSLEDEDFESKFQPNISGEEEFENDKGSDADSVDKEKIDSIEDSQIEPMEFSKVDAFVCQICHTLKWSKSDILVHSYEMHPDKIPSFVSVKTEPAEDGNFKNNANKNSLDKNKKASDKSSEDIDYSEIRKLNNADFTCKKFFVDNVSNIKMYNVDNTKYSSMTTSQLLKSKASLYQCRLCKYKSNKMTVMRHHVMSHLRYHPYVCPYCDQARSVKSFPIKKHVAAKHPGEDVVAMHLVNKEIEKKISNSYYKIKLSALSDDVDANYSSNFSSKSTNKEGNHFRKEFHESMNDIDEDNDGEESDQNEKLNEEDDNGEEIDEQESVEDSDDGTFNKNTKNQKSIFANEVVSLGTGNVNNNTQIEEFCFKCKFCSYNTTIQSNMKHHLMNELNYKPYKCNLCPFRDAQKPVISKHFQKLHSTTKSPSSASSSPSKNYVELQIKEDINIEKEDLIKKMLNECRKAAADDNSAKSKIVQPQSPIKKQHQQQDSNKPINKSMSSIAYSNNIAKLNPIPLKPGSKIFKCPECSYTNISLKLVRGHMVKHGPHRLKCAYCDYKAHYPSRIRKHTRRQHSGLTFNYTNISEDNVNFGKSNDKLVSGKVHSQLSLLQKNNVDFDESITTNNKSNTSSPKVYLDGVPIDLPLVAHSDGWYRCQFCDYESLNRDNFKCHLVTHKPRRWKCYYCEQKYPVVFRVRRHCNMKHNKLPIRWIDVETGKVCSDSKLPHFTANSASVSILKKSKHCTARKSFGFKNNVALKRKSLTSTDKLFTLSPYDSELSIYNCHICQFAHSSPTFLIKHIKIEHSWTDKLPKIEIFPKSDDGQIWALRRCGFCLFESYDAKAFKQHVLKHTIWPPSQCSFCSFASFSQTATLQHVRLNHSEELNKLEKGQNFNEDNNTDKEENMENGESEKGKEIKRLEKYVEMHREVLCKELTDEYTMVGDDANEQIKPVDWEGNFESYVQLYNFYPKQENGIDDDEKIDYDDDFDEDDDKDIDDEEDDDNDTC